MFVVQVFFISKQPYFLLYMLSSLTEPSPPTHNLSVLKGRSTDDVIHSINAIMEHARSDGNEVWLVLQDMKRAFDSVDPKALSMSMRRLKIPEKYIQLHEYINSNRENCIITEHGITDFYKPLAGVPQGGVECPLHWLIFYDALLSRITNKYPGFEMSSKTLHPLESEQVASEVALSAIAYVEDTTWVAKNKAEMDGICLTAHTWFKMMGIQVNPSKTKLIVINETPDTKEMPFTFGGATIQRCHPSKGERLLGVYLSADGLHKTQKEVITLYINESVSILTSAAITDQQMVYIANSVLTPAIAYKCKLLPLTEAEIQSINSKILTLVKHKANLASSTANCVMNHHNMYNVKDLAEFISEEQLTGFYNRMEGAGISYETTRMSAMHHANKRFSVEESYCNPAITAGKQNTYINKVLKLAAKASISWFQPDDWNSNSTSRSWLQSIEKATGKYPEFFRKTQ